MGLDIVNVVMRCEETFEIELQDSKLEQMRTVGDLFELICEQLALPHGLGQTEPSPIPGLPPETPTRNTIWLSLVPLIQDQLQIPREDITYTTSFQGDLGAD